MDIKVNQINKPMQVEQPVQQQQGDGALSLHWSAISKSRNFKYGLLP